MDKTQTLDDILVVAKKLMTFMETREKVHLDGVFAADELVLIDSFFPYVFKGEGAGEKWADGFINHAREITHLRHTFGEPQESGLHDRIAFLSLPVTWEGESKGQPFHETGGLALVMVQQGGQWMIRNYGWAATSYTEI